MISSVISRLSALVLFAAGAILLFASDIVLPAIAPGFPTAAAWLGQLLAGGWFGVAALNWLQRNASLGGIYGRPTVIANLALYVISTLGLLGTLRSHAAPSMLWIAVVIGGVLAVAYGALLLRGPFGVSRDAAG